MKVKEIRMNNHTELENELKNVGYYIIEDVHGWFFTTSRKTKSGFYKTKEQCLNDAHDNALKHGVFEV